MTKKSQVLVVVPARGGSKGIPLKNLVTLGGRSLIQIVGDFIQTVDCIATSIVSTDHEGIAKAAREAGLEVPFLRPEELAGDIVSDVDVLTHALLETERIKGVHYEIIVKGNRVETKVDGKTVVVYEEGKDVKGKRKLSTGTIGLQAHDPGSVVLVKNIKVKSL